MALWVKHVWDASKMNNVDLLHLLPAKGAGQLAHVNEVEGRNFHCTRREFRYLLYQY